MDAFTIRTVRWSDASTALRRIRTAVFIEEQHVPEALEWDGADETACHLLAESRGGQPIGTARLLPDGHIGRVAVLRPWRGRGVGRALMRKMLELAARQGHRHVYLDAQLEAIDFYRRLDFRAEGDIFMDAGIPHRRMRRQLDT